MIRNIGPFRKMLTGDGGRLFPPYFPLTLPGLEEYYDSRLGLSAFANGATITNWPDQSGHSPTRDMTTTGLIGGMVGPTFNKTSGLSPKGTPLVSFNGTNMGLTTSTFTIPAATNGHSFYVYGTFRETTAPPAAFAGADIWMTSTFTAVPKELLFQTVGTKLLNWRDSGGFHGTHTHPVGIHQLAFVFTPPNVGVIYIDGVAVNTLTYTFGGVGADTTSLSDTINNNVPLNADLGHFVWYSRAHTAAQVSAHFLWASIFWGF